MQSSQQPNETNSLSDHPQRLALSNIVDNPNFLIAAGALCGGFINGLAGFGTSLFALAWFLQVLPPLEAVALTLVLSVLSGFPGLIVVRRHILVWRLAKFAIPALFGIPLGLFLLGLISIQLLKAGIASFLIGYGIYFFSRNRLEPIPDTYPILDMIIGFLGGILGALASLSGALPTIWISMKPWEKMEQRGVLQPYNMVVLALSAIAMWWASVYQKLSLDVWMAAIPFTILGSLVGVWLFQKLTTNQFVTLVVSLTTLSGIALFLQLFFSQT